MNGSQRAPINNKLSPSLSRGTTTTKAAMTKALASLLQRSVDKDLSLFLLEGHWFVSLYNDYGDSQRLALSAAPAPDLTEGCPGGCSGANGECVDGHCVCKAGFGGEDCSEGEITTTTILAFARGPSRNVTLHLWRRRGGEEVAADPKGRKK